MNDFVLLKEAKAQPYHTFKGYEKIVVPDAYEHGPEDRPVMGQILAKGDSCVKDSIQVGALAICGKWTGSRFFRDEQTYVLVRESDILGVLTA